MDPKPGTWNLELGIERLCNVQDAQNFGSGGSHPPLCQVVTAATLSVDVLITLYRLHDLMSRDCSCS
jgi:hypothetical protein